MTKQKPRKPLLQLYVKHRDAHSRGSSIAEAAVEFALERISSFLNDAATQLHIPFEMLTARIQEQGAANLLNSLGYRELQEENIFLTLPARRVANMDELYNHLLYTAIKYVVEKLAEEKVNGRA